MDQKLVNEEEDADIDVGFSHGLLDSFPNDLWDITLLGAIET